MQSRDEDVPVITVYNKTFDMELEVTRMMLWMFWALCWRDLRKAMVAMFLFLFVMFSISEDEQVENK